MDLKLKPRNSKNSGLVKKAVRVVGPRVTVRVTSGKLPVRLSGSVTAFLKPSRKLERKLPLMILSAALLAAFATGFFAALSTSNIVAEDGQKAVPATPAGNILLEGVQVVYTNDIVNNDALFSMTIDQLEDYLRQQTKAPSEPAKPQEQIPKERKEKLVEYLKSKRSRFAADVDVLAELPHWKLVLAISFAESTMGRSCPDNNCSGIGVAPGHRLWRKYTTIEDWMKDFNSLLDRRYKDWTLEKMCGVYVQPCNPNWLKATRQVFGELAERGIE